MTTRPADVRATARRARVVTVCGLAAALSLWAFSGHAEQTSGPVVVTVNLQTGVAVPTSDQCTFVGAFGARVTISCSPGAVRFITQPPSPGKAGDVDAKHMEAGTVTSWRRIKLENGEELLEMTVQW